MVSKERKKKKTYFPLGSVISEALPPVSQADRSSVVSKIGSIQQFCSSPPPIQRSGSEPASRADIITTLEAILLSTTEGGL